jgi:hypothetical protein
MRVSVAADDLRVPRTQTKTGFQPPAKRRPSGSEDSHMDARLTFDRAMTFSPEIQLLGQTVEEALAKP